MTSGPVSEYAKMGKSPLDYPSPTNKLRNRIARLAARALFNAVVVTGFTGIVITAVWLFRNGYPILISVSTLVVFTVAALFVGANWRERTICSMSVPFWAIGGYIGYQSFLALFDYSPFGLVVSLLGFAAVFGVVAWVCMYRLSLWLLPAKTNIGNDGD